MGPAVPLLVVVIIGAPLFACLFCIFRFRYSTRSAFALAASFVGGAGVAAILAALIAMLVIGIGPTLESSVAVVLYLGWLASASVAGGITATYWQTRPTGVRPRTGSDPKQ